MDDAKKIRRAAQNKTHRYSFRMNTEQETRMREMMEEAGLKNKSRLIVGRIFGQTFKRVVTVPEKKVYYTRLTDLYGQMRLIGLEYNQTVKVLNVTYGDRRAEALIRKLEKNMQDLCGILQSVIDVMNEANANL